LIIISDKLEKFQKKEKNILILNCGEKNESKISCLKKNMARVNYDYADEI